MAGDTFRQRANVRLPRTGAVCGAVLGLVCIAVLAVLTAYLNNGHSLSARRTNVSQPARYRPPRSLSIHSDRPEGFDLLLVQWHGATVGTRGSFPVVGQVRVAGRWENFAVSWARLGRYRFKWQFAHHPHPVTYVVRALYPGESTRGVPPVASTPVRVRVE
jgi:hypothetical protein